MLEEQWKRKSAAKKEGSERREGRRKILLFYLS